MKARNIKTHLPLLLCLLSVLSINIYFRAFPVYFPQFKKQAAEIVEDSIRREAIQGIAKKFPEYNSLARDKLIKNLVADYKQGNKKLIKERTQDIYRQMKDKYQDRAGQTYLMELDCWHWARYVDNINRTGHPGDEVIKGRQWDKLMLAPVGAYMLWNNFLFYFSSFAYKVFNYFKPVPLFTFLFYLPFLFITIFIIVLYLFAYRQGGNIAAIIACLIAGLSGIFIPRSCAGWFDADILNLLFPIAIIWTYLSSYRQATPKKRLIRLILSGFWVGLFCAIWLGWWFIFLIVILYELYSLLRLYFDYRIRKLEVLPKIKEHSISLGYFTGLSLFWVILFCGFGPLSALFVNVKEALILNKALISSIWPNVYSTVGELKPFNFNEIANSSGGKVIFVSSIIAMLIFLWRAVTGKESDSFRSESSVILFLWFAAMFFACFKGVRFTMFILVPTGIFLGMLVNEAYERIKIWKKELIAGICAVIITLSIAYPVLKKAYNTASSVIPLIDDNWYDVLTLVKERTPQDAILNSWWDFGDWFKVVAGRRVIFDGQSQNSPQAYWMARALLTSSEEESVAILRMLNNGGNRAFEIIDSQIKNPLKSALLLESLLPSNPEIAKNVLSKFLDASAVEQVSRLLLDTPPSKAFFVVDPSMQFKMPAISFLGNWDFDKVYLTQNFNKLERGELTGYLVKLGRSPTEVQRMYQEALLIPEKDLDDWISHRSQFYSGAVNGRKKGEEVFFDNGFIYNPNSQTIYSGSHQIPQSLFVFFKQDNLVEIIYPNANMGLSALAYKTDEEGNYQMVLLNRELAGSLFARLYFLDGLGLRHFKPFIVSGNNGNFIRIFEIAWDRNG